MSGSAILISLFLTLLFLTSLSFNYFFIQDASVDRAVRYFFVHNACVGYFFVKRSLALHYFFVKCSLKLWAVCYYRPLAPNLCVKLAVGILALAVYKRTSMGYEGNPQFSLLFKSLAIVPSSE